MQLSLYVAAVSGLSIGSLTAMQFQLKKYFVSN